MILPVHPNIVRRSDPYTTGKLACLVAMVLGLIVIVGGMLIERMPL